MYVYVNSYAPFRQMLIGFHIETQQYRTTFVMNWSLKFPPQLKHVASLPCKIYGTLLAHRDQPKSRFAPCILQPIATGRDTATIWSQYSTRVQSIGLQTERNIAVGCGRKPCWVFPAEMPRCTSHASDTGFSLRHFSVADAAAEGH